MSRGNLPFFVFRRSLEVFFMLYVLGGIFLMGWGALMFLRPDIFYELTEAWKTRQGNPSESYLRNTRFGGAVCFLAGLVCTALLLVN
jgi:hypothetical protein